MSNHKLSAVIITLNEERNIERCIDALKPIADEILVVDSYSEDKTESICKQKNVRFIQTEWKGYAETKNYANSLTEHDYIFSVDADEAPDEKLQNEILALKKSGLNDTYAVNRLTNYCGVWIKNSGWYPDWKIRIFNKKNTQWKGEFVHEELAFSNKVAVKKIKGHLLHFSYYNFQEHQERADKYSKLTAKKLFKNGKKANVFKPFFSAFGRFIAMYFIKKGFLDGKMGYKIALISAKSNFLKYKTLNKLNYEKN